MSKISDAPPPDLRIVPIDRIMPHEYEDEQRAEPLIRRLPQDGVLVNPPIVTELNDSGGRFVILDGTNRVIALNVLHYEHALVQVVRYEDPYVELYTWNHVVDGIIPESLHQQFRAIPGLDVEPADALHVRAALARRSILAYCLLADGKLLGLSGGGMDLHERTRLLQAVVETYLHGQLHRSNLDQLDQIKEIYPEMAAAIVFPKYEPVEILDLAEAGLPVPTGITRHVIHGRVLRLNYPLVRLSAEVPLEQKNAELAEWVRTQFANRGVRYYAESTYLFDE
jgi:hypothetical protein